MIFKDWVSKNEKKANFIFDLCVKGAIVTFLFLVITFVLLIITYSQYKIINPNNNINLENLRDEYKEDPNSEELVNQIRQLDFLSRKAFLVSSKFLELGGRLLFFFFIMFLIFTKTAISLNKSINNKVVSKSYDFWNERKIIIKWAGLSGLLLVVIVLSGTFVINRPQKTINQNSKSSVSLRENIGDNWPSFRGPLGNGVVNDSINIDSLNIKWKIKIDSNGFNSPVIWNSNIYFSGAERKNYIFYSFDIETGEQNWEKKFEIPDSKQGIDVSEDTGVAASTITVNEDYIFGIFATGELFCINHSGEKMWIKDFGSFQNIYGHSSSLIIAANVLIVQIDDEEAGRVFGINPINGEVLWTVNRDVITSWSSPLLAEYKSKNYLIINGNPLVSAINPLTGEILWSLDCMLGEVAVSPAFIDGKVLICNEYASLLCLDITSGEILWEDYPELPSVSSPVVVNNNIYVPTSYGVLSCLSLEDGSIKWSEEFQQGFYSSPIIIGDILLIANLNGVLYFLSTGDGFNILKEINLEDVVVATPGYYNGKIIIRSNNNLFCLDTGI